MIEKVWYIWSLHPNWGRYNSTLRHGIFGHEIWDGNGLVALNTISIGFCTFFVTKEKRPLMHMIPLID